MNPKASIMLHVQEDGLEWKEQIHDIPHTALMYACTHPRSHIPIHPHNNTYMDIDLESLNSDSTHRKMHLIIFNLLTLSNRNGAEHPTNWTFSNTTDQRCVIKIQRML